jgi:hypothetical protein
MTPPTVRLTLLFNRATVEAEKISLRSLEDLEPTEWREKAITDMRSRIAAQEAILDANESKGAR